MSNNLPDPLHDVVPWILQRIAQAVEAGELPAADLDKLGREVKTGQVLGQKISRSEAVRVLAELWGCSVDQLEAELRDWKTSPEAMREMLLAQILDKLRQAGRAGAD